MRAQKARGTGARAYVVKTMRKRASGGDDAFGASGWSARFSGQISSELALEPRPQSESMAILCGAFRANETPIFQQTLLQSISVYSVRPEVIQLETVLLPAPVQIARLR